MITGAASGIGAAGAKLFAQEGAKLVLFDRDPKGAQVAEAICAEGGTAEFVEGDVGDDDTVRRLISGAVKRFGKLDLIWSNAGVPVFKTIVDTTNNEWNQIVSTNLTGGYLMCKYAIPELIHAGGGTVVFTASTASFVGSRRWAAYCATKGGVLMLARATALDYADVNVRVNCVCPGATDTPLQEADMRAKLVPYEEALRDELAAHPMHRYATPEEVARAALFLSCEDSSNTTGSALMVDGGLTAQ